MVNTAEKVSFVASTLANFATYLSNTTGNDEDKKFYEKMRTLAFLVMLGTGAGSLAAQRKAVKLADDLLYRLSQPGLTFALSDPAKAFLISIAQTEKYFDSIIGKIDAVLDTYAPGTTNNITPLFSAFNKEEKLGFYFDFVQMDDINKWLKLNNDEAIAVKNWKKLYNLGAVDRTAMEVITNTSKTVVMERFYSVTAFKKSLEAKDCVRRWSLLNNYGNVDQITFNRMKIHPEFIGVFFGHTPEVQKILGQKGEIWLKSFEARTLYKNKKWNEIAELYDKDYIPPLTFNSLPGQNWVDGDLDFTEIIAHKISDIIDNIGDTSQISANLNVSDDVVLFAKQNYFEKERFQLIPSGKVQLGRFTKTDSDLYSQIEEWKNASKNIFVSKEEFKYFLAHEYVEGKLIDKYGMGYRGTWLLFSDRLKLEY
ncbi:hypothetical protein [Chryseobacterium koreense]|uniref:hypothetical protein n=1 Tax=Chryseobacterium koreense TaxID=232216 RepID=UPI0026EC4BD9|nr:hypothetical protein [Chryseobacterium koreense]